MKKFTIVKTIMLSFIEKNEQIDYLFRAGDGIVELEGSTVWFETTDGRRFESITTANIVPLALEQGNIKEVTETG
jgi:hypothetical protein